MKCLRIFLPSILSLLLVLSGCAMQRAVEAEEAQTRMLGMTKEQVFACMGIPKKKAKEGETEIWAYKSTNGFSTKSKTGAGSSSDFSNKIGASLFLTDEIKERRFCTVQIVMKDGAVQAVNYNGPTGGFLTEDEQCAYAVRNCVK